MAQAMSLPRPRAPIVTVHPDGKFAFVEPLVCDVPEQTELENSTQVTARPNMGVLVVGIVATSLGIIGMAAAGAGHDPGGDPLLYAGIAGAAVGLPLVIGPLIGNGVENIPGSTQTITKRVVTAPCGEQPLAGQTATMTINAFHAYGAITNGEFSLSPFLWVDAFAVGPMPGLSITANVDDNGKRTPITSIIDPSALITARDEFLATSGIDIHVEPFKKLARIEAGLVHATRTTVNGVPTLRIVLPLTNIGPGEAWQVRGLVTAEDAEIDGRVMYIGHIANGATAQGEIDVVMSPALAKALDDASIDLSVVLHDAYNSVSSAPVRYRGAVLNDFPH